MHTINITLRYKFVVVMIIPLFSAVMPAIGSDRTAVEKAQALINSPFLTSTSDKYVEALATLKEVSGADDMRKYTLQTLSAYGWVALNLKRFDIADMIFSRAQTYCTAQDSSFYYDTYSALAYIELSDGSLDGSYHKLVRCRAFYNRKGDAYHQILTAINMGTYYRLTDDKVKAKQVLRQAYDEAVRKRQPLLQIEVLLAIFACEDDTELDQATVEKAIKLAQNNNVMLLYPKCQLALARCYDGHMKDEQALVAFDKVIDLARRYNDGETLNEALRRKGDIYERRNNYHLAFALYKQLLAAQQQETDKNKKSVEALIADSRKLINWCDKNVRMENGKFETVDESSPWASSLLFLPLVAALSVAVALLDRKILIQRGQLNNGKSEMELLKGKVNDMQGRIESCENKKKQMEHQIAYLLLFFNHHNVLLDKVRNAIRQCYGSDNAQNTKLRKICSQLVDYRLSPLSSELAAGEESVMRGYQERLLRLYPSLSKNEVVLATYIFLGLSTHEICILTGNQSQSVNVGRYRLRKSLHLNGEQSLEETLRNV